MGRGPTGLTAAALPLAGAAWPVATGNYLIAAGLVALSLVIVIGTFAPRMPGLYRLPLVGAPWLRASFKIDGDPSLVIEKPPNQRVTRTLEIGVGTKHRPGVSRADVNILYPDLVTLEPSDWEGKPEKRGKAMRPTDEVLLAGRSPTPYWAEEGREFRGSRVLYYRFSTTATGRFPIRLKIDSPDLKKGFQAEAAVVVNESRDEALPTKSSGRAESEHAAKPVHQATGTAKAVSGPQARRAKPAKPVPTPPSPGESLEEGIAREIAFGKKLRDGLPTQPAPDVFMGILWASREDVQGWVERVAFLFAEHEREDLRDSFLRASPPRAYGVADQGRTLAEALSDIVKGSGPTQRKEVETKLARLDQIRREL